MGTIMTDGTALFSIIVAMYKVEPYLPAFLASLDAQGDDLADAEIVFVDDGSPDDSRRIVEEWAATRDANTVVVAQENQGVAAARESGTLHAGGTWITYADPDDVLEPGYLRSVRDALQSAKETDVVPTIVSTRLIYTDDTLLTRRDAHPLKKQFSAGRRIVSLRDDPQLIKLSAATSFLRREDVLTADIHWDHRIRPNFEDAAFIARYLLTFDDPTVLVVPEARYLYRRRTATTSLTTTSWQRVEKYIDVPEFGWLAPMEDAVRMRGGVPVWLQNTVLYDIYWYFHYDAQIHSPTRWIPQDVKDRFLETVRRVLSLIDPEVIAAYRITPLSPQLRAVLMSIGGHSLPLSPVHLWRADKRNRQVLIKYYFAGGRPEEVLTVGGEAIAPAYAKDRSIVYFGHDVLHERILWIEPREGLTVRLDGQRAEIRYNAPGNHELAVTNESLRARLGLPARAQRLPAPPAAPNKATKDLLPARLRKRVAQVGRIVRGESVSARRPWAAAARRAAASPAARSRFANAWVFMDRDVQAQDNAEHLYRWVLRNRPDVNAFYVLRKSSSDWARLRDEGFHLVDYGSTEHFMLMHHAKFLISSHVDHYVLQPWSTKLLRKRDWQFVFLQHGVTKDDISRWLNRKPIRLLLTTGQAEFDGFVNDGTPYTFTNREVTLTGFPRHDALAAKAAALPAADRNLVLVMPTWREYLMTSITNKGTMRGLIDDFDDTVYATQWRKLLAQLASDPGLAGQGCRIGFVPHPSLEPHLDRLGVPAGIEVFRYRDNDIQSVIARARVLVTDYSSLAFEAAYIETPVVYFQFDAAQFFDEHPHRAGYFDYERNGFGPLTEEADEAADAIRAAVLTPESVAHYADRATAFFIDRDGRNSERAFEAIAPLG
ncbi:glycosyltransferase [Microbacterium oleivorans]|uniref:bifunctional glycosyltransferase/CDP-glycerol:glycerophosphate glycerophosphotransferase n=1 Tax=Microbacterium oleivorans TaxID=273677 RepID=UPI0010A31440|nr:CDP-glycerol glycerophosphotransferase family protein [Microbacterium oleivorans]THE07564.1 glycosyltransferase [Microbacterium oleivorans]